MGEIIEVPLEEELKESYLDYAMSVIVGRALPDVRDGLKPVQRRILYAMYEAGNEWNKPFKKSARIVGDVIGKYHPHGDMPVYEALVRMAQDFTMRYPLVDGQGNFGSIDGDPPAAMRYTEVRLTRIAHEMLADLEKETVEFVPNYDNTLKEPVVLPSKLPNLLVNGASGIAVGMATSIPPHNLGEVISACLALLRNPDLTTEELMEHIKGPDFPTGAYIVGKSAILSAYETGKGTIKLRAKYHVEREKNKVQLVFTEIPYQVNKASVVEKIARLIKEKKLEAATEVRDESDRHGIRVVVELKKEWANAPHLVAKEIFAQTPLETNFGIILLALVNGRPEVLTLKDLLQHFLNWRRTVVIRRTQYELRKAKERAHILEGFLKALEHLDEIIELIKSSDTPKTAKDRLIARFNFTEVQAQEILNLRLQRLTALEREKILLEYEELKRAIAQYEKILTHEPTLIATIEEELRKLKEDFADERRTQIIEEEETEVILEKPPQTPVLVLLSEEGFIRKINLEEFTTQKRGGKGALAVYGEERISQAIYAFSDDTVLIFTEEGRVYPLSLKDVPTSTKQAKGNHLRNYLPNFEGAPVALLPLREEGFILMATAQGNVKKVLAKDFQNLRKTGRTAIILKKADKLRSVLSLEKEGTVLLATKNGQSLHFETSELRPMGRESEGVIGIRLEEKDEVIAMVETKPKGYVFTITEGGFGKKTDITEFRIQRRGGLGISLHKLSAKTGPLASALFLEGSEDVIIISSSGKAIRISSEEIPTLARSTQGSRMITILPGERVTKVIKIEKEFTEKL
jgi:DNA gyrase subunit A